MDRLVDRRTALRVAGLGVASTVAAPALTGCAAAVFNPATIGWYGALTSSLGASLLATGLETAFKAGWESWKAGRDKILQAQQDEGFGWFDLDCYGDHIPPAIFSKALRTTESDPMSDRLIICVQGGEKYVAFDPWAWQTLAMFVDDLTKDREGDDLARYRALASTTLTPAGTAPTGSSTNYSQLLRYQARNGGVEFNASTQSNGQTRVQIIVEGIPKSNGGPTIKEFTLPRGPEI
ncbi:hypothetical protein [Rhodococcus sp. IEGM 1379]|uniref:hypothetical protein n=1 Tax=Rhodococcus sp. IEGM 1379 TaxID=3047086 RepID=UPI0024B70616|nr:hypothetical protein [Rhodococcus sp. IEGM 1379]MDI9914381.1 hypothetical protein [Rhodococcus sp. IEGM 1379]